MLCSLLESFSLNFDCTTDTICFRLAVHFGSPWRLPRPGTWSESKVFTRKHRKPSSRPLSLSNQLGPRVSRGSDWAFLAAGYCHGHCQNWQVAVENQLARLATCFWHTHLKNGNWIRRGLRLFETPRTNSELVVLAVAFFLVGISTAVTNSFGFFMRK